MTKFSFEVPLKHLEDFADLQDYIFALSFLCEYKEYVEYVLKEKRKKLIVLDNSFNELGVAQSAKEMRECASKIMPNYTVSPDDDAWDTSQILKAYEEMRREGFSSMELIVPVRSTEEWKELKYKGDVYNFAIPYEYRPLFSKEISWHKMHFLGLRDPLEIKMCQPLSCDTSMPIKIALQGVTLREWILQCCPHIDTVPDFFNLELSDETIKLARENIIQLKEVCAS